MFNDRSNLKQPLLNKNQNSDYGSGSDETKSKLINPNIQKIENFLTYWYGKDEKHSETVRSLEVELKGEQLKKLADTLGAIEGIRVAFVDMTQKIELKQPTTQAVHAFSRYASIYCDNLNAVAKNNAFYQIIKTFATEIDPQGLCPKISASPQGELIKGLLAHIRKENSQFLYSNKTQEEAQPVPQTTIKRTR